MSRRQKLRSAALFPTRRAVNHCQMTQVVREPCRARVALDLTAGGAATPVVSLGPFHCDSPFGLGQGCALWRSCRRGWGGLGGLGGGRLPRFHWLVSSWIFVSFFSEFFSALSAHTFPWMRRLSRPAAHVAGILPCVREHAACFQFISNLKVTGRPASNRVLSTHTTCRAR